MARKKKSAVVPVSGKAETSSEVKAIESHQVEVLDPDEDSKSDSWLPDPETAAPIIAEVLEVTEEAEKEDVEEEEDKNVVPYDALQAYLKEVSRYSSLSKEEEKELALQYYNNKDVEAAYRLVSSNLWLVVKIARDYERAARSLLDLVQEGNIGLMEAVKNFDPFREVRFPSYAAWWIKAYIIRYIIANWRLVKIGTTQAQRKLFFNLNKEKERLEREGFYAGPKLIADRLNVRESDVVEMEQRLGLPDLSVDAPLSAAESDSNLHSMLPSSSLSAEDMLEQKEQSQLVTQSLAEFASTLNPRELIIFRERMLAESDAKATLQDISEKLKVSRERVRQLEVRVEEKLKEFLKDKDGVLEQFTK